MMHSDKMPFQMRSPGTPGQMREESPHSYKQEAQPIRGHIPCPLKLDLLKQSEQKKVFKKGILAIPIRTAPRITQDKAWTIVIWLGTIVRGQVSFSVALRCKTTETQHMI